MVVTIRNYDERARSVVQRQEKKKSLDQRTSNTTREPNDTPWLSAETLSTREIYRQR
jgi:hypothetical protein